MTYALWTVILLHALFTVRLNRRIRRMSDLLMWGVVAREQQGKVVARLRERLGRDWSAESEPDDFDTRDEYEG